MYIEVALFIVILAMVFLLGFLFSSLLFVASLELKTPTERSMELEIEKIDKEIMKCEVALVEIERDYYIKLLEDLADVVSVKIPYMECTIERKRKEVKKEGECGKYENDR
jgi:hypothetical protein